MSKHRMLVEDSHNSYEKNNHQFRYINPKKCILTYKENVLSFTCRLELIKIFNCLQHN
ncbi:hypothetical protein TUM4249_40290 [Shewanella sp. KT0246]|nr:hypothetical protein TUM4249_40290 [Shewanella sp. KT0246]